MNMSAKTPVGLALVVAVIGAGCSDSGRPADSSVDQGVRDHQAAPEMRADGTKKPDLLLPDTKPRPPAKWDTLASMAQARAVHTVTALKNGKLLVAGGASDDYGASPLKSAELYDPAAKTWTSAGEMSTPHWGHAAVLLDDGRVLVVGGCSTEYTFSCMLGTGADLYDPQSGSWKVAKPVLSFRQSLCATLLQDGRVLVAGGFDNLTNHTSIEIYDPKADAWSSPLAVLSTPRNKATATTLKNGKVLIAGGTDGIKVLDTIDLFDPATGTMKTLSAKLSQPRWLHTATRLADGRVLFVGGACDLQLPACDVANADLYDPATDKVVPAGSPGTGVRYHTTTLLLDGRALVTGGLGAKTRSLLFDAATLSWGTTADMTTGRVDHAAALLGERVIVTGGMDKSDVALSSVEAYTP
jgi:N-acetylneuraminic acid mutarotase